MGLFGLAGHHDNHVNTSQTDDPVAHLNEPSPVTICAIKRCAQLEQQLVKAQQEAKQAKQRALNAEDTLRLKNQLLDNLERSLSLEQDRANSLADQVAAREMDLRLLKQDLDKVPISDADLLHRYKKQTELIELLEETLTCPICYVPFSREQATSLLCGHAFCEPCFKAWEVKHAAAWKASSQQGAYHGPDCPECRSSDVRRGRVRIFALEEVVRLVERGIRELKVPHYESTPPPPPTPPAENVVPASLVVDDALGNDPTGQTRNQVDGEDDRGGGEEAFGPVPVTTNVQEMDIDHEPSAEVSSAGMGPSSVRPTFEGMRSTSPTWVIDEDAARILRPRVPSPYTRVFSRA
ncbi:hypothetical protein ACM66B_006285 [Microbotryomycetes sp. NB124-2]